MCTGIRAHLQLLCLVLLRHQLTPSVQRVGPQRGCPAGGRGRGVQHKCSRGGASKRCPRHTMSFTATLTGLTGWVPAAASCVCRPMHHTVTMGRMHSGTAAPAQQHPYLVEQKPCSTNEGAECLPILLQSQQHRFLPVAIELDLMVASLGAGADVCVIVLDELLFRCCWDQQLELCHGTLPDVDLPAHTQHMRWRPAAFQYQLLAAVVVKQMLLYCSSVSATGKTSVLQAWQREVSDARPEEEARGQ